MRGFQPANKKPTKGGPVRGPGTGTSDEVADTVADGTYIMPTDSTEAIGDGKIFVLDLASATRIRTGETGDTAL